MSDTRLHRAGPAALERARELRPLIDREAAVAEELGRLTDPVVDALHEAGIFRIWIPEVLGGAELSPMELLDVFEELAYADPSTAWVVMACTLANGTGGAYLGDAAIERIFAGPRAPQIAGQGTRAGVAVPEDGGYRLSGQWSFGSGILHAQYAHSAGAVEGTDEVRICITPIEDVKMLGNWDVLGLRATGSVDYAIEGAFVPEAWSHVFTLDEPPRGGAIYRLGLIDQALICHSGWALGLGRRLLDELARYAAERTGRAGQIAGTDAFQTDFAHAEVRFRAASVLSRQTWRDAEKALEEGRRLSVREETMLRLALNHITSTVSEVARFVYASCATTALRDGLVQRLVRDAMAGAAHITSSPQVLAECGRELAGLAPGESWMVLNLQNLQQA